MQLHNIKLIGTSHIASQSIKEVEDCILNERPDIVALELDMVRLNALLKGEQRRVSLADIRRIGFKGYLFILFGSWVQRKLGAAVGIAPGAEMKAAFRMARSMKLKVALIDRPIEVTLRRFSSSLSWREKFNFLEDLLRAIFFSRSEARKIKRDIGLSDLDLSRVPEERLISYLLKKTEERYPNVYKVLVTERNHFMAAALRRISMNEPDKKILAVVGAGHLKGLEEELKCNSQNHHLQLNSQS